MADLDECATSWPPFVQLAPAAVLGIPQLAGIAASTYCCGRSFRAVPAALPPVAYCHACSTTRVWSIAAANAIPLTCFCHSRYDMLEKQLEAKDRPAAAEANGKDRGSDKKERKEKRSHRDEKDRKRHRRCGHIACFNTPCAAKTHPAHAATAGVHCLATV